MLEAEVRANVAAAVVHQVGVLALVEMEAATEAEVLQARMEATDRAIKVVEAALEFVSAEIQISLGVQLELVMVQLTKGN